MLSLILDHDFIIKYGFDIYVDKVKARRRVPRIISSQSPIVFVKMWFIDWLKMIVGTRCSLLIAVLYETKTKFDKSENVPFDKSKILPPLRDKISLVFLTNTAAALSINMLF